MACAGSGIQVDRIDTRIHVIHGQNVMVDSELAELYGVETRVLIQAVKRNARRFPGDFVFRLNKDESKCLTSQTVISNGSGRGGRRRLPYVFTEQGVAMLSSVLRSERAIQVNVEIMRAFVRMRRVFVAHGDLGRKVNRLEEKVACHDEAIRSLVAAIRNLIADPGHGKRRKQIGFLPGAPQRK